MMTAIDHAPWDLDELCRRADEITGVVGQADGRVRGRPDARMVRYYTTLGLVDRPVLRGRSGYYGERHLKQLVAIKRLQADGASLAEVQSRLLGLDDGGLAEVAGFCGGEVGPGAALTGERSGRHGRGSFWGLTPEPALGPGAATVTVTGLPLGGGAMLLVPAEGLAEGDREALLRAASPLVEALRVRGLVGRSDES
jgi:DNA-binding transcriptional MerR regulator